MKLYSLITGSAGLLGKYHAEALLQLNFNIVLTDIDQKKLIPMNRLAKKKEYMGAIKFLCSSDSDYMTGQNLVIDGGRSVW